MQSQPSLDTENLVKMSQKGDLKAFETLVLSYSKWLLGLCVSTSGRQDVEDICQEIWISAWKNLGSCHLMVGKREIKMAA